MATPTRPIEILAFLSGEGLTVPTLRIVDVGAMDLGEQEPWMRLVTSGTASLIGFEANPVECKKLNRSGRANCRFLAHALGDGIPHTLHIGKESMHSSLFPPDPEIMQRFHSL